MTFRSNTLKKAKITRIKKEIAHIESDLAKGWIESPPNDYERLLRELGELEAKP